jgi:heterodisulfide reductase subunit C
MIAQILFVIVLAVGVFLFARRIREIRRNIGLGRSESRNDRKGERWKVMTLVALGQSKMITRPVAGIMHLLIYIGFVIINIEVLEILIDGITGQHRIFAHLGLGSLYDVLIGSFEILAAGVLLACVVFLLRRNVINIRRFHAAEMTTWPKSDANIILVVEILLMFAFLSMNATDSILQDRVLAMQEQGVEVSESLSHYIDAGSFPVSDAFFRPMYEGIESNETLMGIERFMWWFHIVGILAFLVYVPYSKHFHIFMAFPNTWYSKLEPKGQMTNLEAVTNEVKLMLDPNADPFAAPAPDANAEPVKFGAKDVQDLTWKQLFDAYTCTECGRCTSVCPANQTGKILSPRKIMMDTRDRVEEVGKNLDENGQPKDDGKSLLRDYISEEELWACTTCNACTEACPVNIDPVGIILDLRRHLIMEESKSPESITAMFNNVENNGAPWAFPAADRGKWTEEMNA